MCCANVTTNAAGIPYLRTANVSVSEESVDFALGFREIAPVGFLTIRITNGVPEGTTGTLPVRLTLNGISRNLTFFGGGNVTAADLTIGSNTGVIVVFNDRFNGILQLVSVVVS